MRNLCKQHQSSRYDVDQALRHPFITRDLQAQIPSTDQTPLLQRVEKEQRLRSGVTLLTLLAVCKAKLQGNHGLSDEYLRTIKQQIDADNHSASERSSSSARSELESRIPSPTHEMVTEFRS